MTTFSKTALDLTKFDRVVYDGKWHRVLDKRVDPRTGVHLTLRDEYLGVTKYATLEPTDAVTVTAPIN